ncbi:sensor histidine kinase [Chryseosolibacter indicus]|uniref:histidine kinase n=1 Tax=Chryseosolibacter indicus TaxID=2782351 RepID=A0ABS5VWX8_9BACT|nr:HAMP domain-containing sensor histidine kinase [Chryseosolibacter indicus]MBT1705928.1 HAMP domain-containing histidine kinase [Chryseosolibacter indicus]
MIWYIDRFNRDIKTFMVNLLQRDFSTHFTAASHGKSFRELYEVLSQISASFMTISKEKEIQHRYLEMLVEHVRVSILSIDSTGKIHLANQALKDLFKKNVLTSLKSIAAIDASLVQAIEEIKTGETRLVKLKLDQEVLQLSMHAAEFKLEDKYYKLISMQNIRNELDAREIEAWQKLIRVLSHEIMNSVSPIISLSGTLHHLVQQNHKLFTEPDQHRTLEAGLEAIKIRSEGLYNFTQSYRKLTGIPKASMKEINIHDLVERVYTLMAPKFQEYRIDFKRSVERNLKFTADPELLEHVLINLINNAVDAVALKNNPTIQVKAQQIEHQILIRVIDNGEGIEEAIADKIFIPFFTTRKHGTGIGLALTKQILQLHHAEIYLNTIPGEGTEFVMVF